MKLNKILWSRVFLWTKEKDKIQSLKQKLTQFTWNKLLYCICSDKEKIWACCCSKSWISWSFWASICYFIYVLVVSWAGFAVFSDRPFIIFFLLVFWSKITILFKFFSKKTNHLWTTLSTLFFLSSVLLSSCPSILLSLQIVLLHLFPFVELSSNSHFLSIYYRSTFTFFKSLFKKLLIFREIFIP